MKMTRKNYCWNCFNSGHMRFQCPFQKKISCSFCRKPNILTSDCTCNEYVGSPQRRNIQNLSNNELQAIQGSNYPAQVQVPITQSDEYACRDNLVVIVNNSIPEIDSDDEDDRDILELYAESDSLEDI